MDSINKKVKKMDKDQIHKYMTEERGFQVIGTGGNCEAYQIFMDDDEKWEILITQDASLPIDDGQKDNDIVVGLYDSIGECVADSDGTLAECLHWYEWAAREVIADIEE